MKDPIKQRIQPYITVETARRLESYVARRNLTESAVVERALREHLDGIGDTTLLYQRLDRIHRAIERLDGTLSWLTEVLNQFLKLWLRNTPPLPAADNRANEAAAKDRYGKLLARVKAAVSSGKTLLHELPHDTLSPATPPTSPDGTAPD